MSIFLYNPPKFNKLRMAMICLFIKTFNRDFIHILYKLPMLYFLFKPENKTVI